MMLNPIWLDETTFECVTKTTFVRERSGSYNPPPTHTFTHKSTFQREWRYTFISYVYLNATITKTEAVSNGTTETTATPGVVRERL